MKFRVEDHRAKPVMVPCSFAKIAASAGKLGLISVILPAGRKRAIAAAITFWNRRSPTITSLEWIGREGLLSEFCEADSMVFEWYMS